MRAVLPWILVLLPLQAWGDDPLLPPTKEEAKAKWGFGLDVRMPIIKGEPAQHNPDAGVGVGIHLERFFTRWFSLRAAVDHDRVFTRRSVPLGGLGIEVSRSQSLTSTSFLAIASFRWSYRWFTVHFGIGLGGYVAYYSNAEVEESRKFDVTEILPGGRLESGVQFQVYKSVRLGLSFDYNFRRSTTTAPDPQLQGGDDWRPFDDQMGIALRFQYLF